MDKKDDEVSRLWKTVFSIKTVIGMVVCVVLVYLATLPFVMKPLYESETIVYVPLTILNQEISQQGIGFGNEHEVDLYIQILRSNTMADSLMKRFGIKNDSRNGKSNLYKDLESRIKVEKTRYSSVSVKVRDHDPEKAAAMANGIINLGETIKSTLLYANRLAAVLYFKSLFESKASEVAVLEKSMNLQRNGTREQLIDKDLSHDKVLTTYKLELQELISRKNQYEHAKKDFDTPLPKVYIVSPAVAADKPDWPKRGLMCVLGGFVYLFLVGVIEIIKRDIRKEPV